MMVPARFFLKTRQKSTEVHVIASNLNSDTITEKEVNRSFSFIQVPSPETRYDTIIDCH